MQRDLPHSTLVLLIAATIAACSGKGAESGSAAAPVRPTVCPGQDFPVFLEAFANDIDVQRSFTVDPYTVVIDDSLHAETGPEVVETPHARLAFPVMLDETALLQHGAHMESHRKAGDWYEVLTYSDGSGAYSMTFNFRFRNGCWYLTDAVDASS